MDKQVMKAEMDDLSASMESLQKSKLLNPGPQQTTNAAKGAVQGRIQPSALGAHWYQRAAVCRWCWTLPVLADGAGIPLAKDQDTLHSPWLLRSSHCNYNQQE